MQSKMRRKQKTWFVGVLCALTLLCTWGTGVGLTPQRAHAFCGFYVSGAEGSLYANATMVALMREGTRTVLSMQNNYQGPPEDFAMVVPVPVVLQEQNVKTLPKQIFSRLDQLAAPRLVEYWEQDPCNQREYPEEASFRDLSASGARRPRSAAPASADMGVRIEAQFEVAEYDVVILSARDSDGLDRWLRGNGYNIPAGAGTVLRPYVESGTKFFVAKVDVSKVQFENGRAVLSPLRVHYDADTFTLPVRLGLLNSDGEQDLLVHVLARGQRYDVANYRNMFIPTNIRVNESVRGNFGGFYEALFRKSIDPGTVGGRAGGTVVTEYSWDAQSCDPCPTPALRQDELMSLGADVLTQNTLRDREAPSRTSRRMRMPPPRPRASGFTLTRLHYRYTKDTLGEDLVFRAVPPVVGGRGVPDADGKFYEEGAKPASRNNFQGRYAMLHPWEGAMTCANPVRGQWGGPPGGRGMPQPIGIANPLMQRSAAPASRASTSTLGSFLDQAIPELNVAPGTPAPSAANSNLHPNPNTDADPNAATDTSEPTEQTELHNPTPKRGGCASCTVGASTTNTAWSLGGMGGIALFGLLMGVRFWRRQRR